MSKKRKQEGKIAEEKSNAKKNTRGKSVETQEKEEVKAPPTNQELLAIEKIKILDYLLNLRTLEKELQKKN